MTSATSSLHIQCTLSTKSTASLPVTISVNPRASLLAAWLTYVEKDGRKTGELECKRVDKDKHRYDKLP